MAFARWWRCLRLRNDPEKPQRLGNAVPPPFHPSLRHHIGGTRRARITKAAIVQQMRDAEEVVAKLRPDFDMPRIAMRHIDPDGLAMELSRCLRPEPQPVDGDLAGGGVDRYPHAAALREPEARRRRSTG